MPDWKPAKRIKDPAALKRFRLMHSGETCEGCGESPGIHVHHRKFRSQGGDDVPGNLSWLRPFVRSATTRRTASGASILDLHPSSVIYNLT